MRKVTALVMASMLAIGSTAAFAADTTSETAPTPGNDATTRTPGQHHMFDGVMHKLVTADKFDEAAVYAQAEQMAQQQVKRQVEMARVRNQMYNLLTPQQKSVLDQKHQQRMQQMEQQISGLQQTSAQKLSTTE